MPLLGALALGLAVLSGCQGPTRAAIMAPPPPAYTQPPAIVAPPPPAHREAPAKVAAPPRYQEYAPARPQQAAAAMGRPIPLASKPAGDSLPPVPGT